MFRFAQHDRCGDNVALQQIHLRALQRNFGESNTDPEKTNWFAGPRESFSEQYSKIRQGGRDSVTHPESALGLVAGYPRPVH